MNVFKPSYENYRKILRTIKRSGKYMDYGMAKEAESFIVLRHDIEFSIDRALKMSNIEDDEGILSTYFLQIASNAYNVFSEKNKKILKQMIHAGHHIGLHYHLKENISSQFICDDIQDQIKTLSAFLEYSVDRFSIHRPIKECQYYSIQIKGIINAYSKEFFTHIENLTEESKLEVKYIADSMHRWNYGYPDEDTFQRNSKIQLLIHPYSWSTEGKDIINTFNDIVDEKEIELLDTFNSETKVFHEIETQIKKIRGI